MDDKVVYLDTNILSRIPDLRVSDNTASAYAELANIGGIRLVTSDKTKQEIRRTQNQVRNSLLQFLWVLIEKVPMQTVYYSGCFGSAPFGATPLGGDWEDPLYSDLRKVFEPDDAEHIVQAVRANCDYFLTLDRESILDRVEKNEAVVSTLCGRMTFVSPDELIKQLRA
jgi:predicted nucleic acid-binding protein